MTAFLIVAALAVGAIGYRALILLRLRKWVDEAMSADSFHDREWTAIRVREAILKTTNWA